MDLLPALLDLGGGGFEVVLDVDEMDELGEGVRVIDDLSVDDFDQLEEVEAAVVLQGLIERNGRNQVPQQLREGQLHNREIRLITRAVLNKPLEILLTRLVVAPEGEAGQQQELLLLRVVLLDDLAGLHRKGLTSFFSLR